MTTLAQPRADVLEKDGVRIARQPDGRLLVICTVGHFTLDAADVALLARLAGVPKTE